MTGRAFLNRGMDMKKEYLKIFRTALAVLILIVWATIEAVGHTPQFRIYKYILYGVEVILGAVFLLAQNAKVCSQCGKVYFTKKDRCPGCGQRLEKLSKRIEKT